MKRVQTYFALSNVRMSVNLNCLEPTALLNLYTAPQQFLYITTHVYFQVKQRKGWNERQEKIRDHGIWFNWQMLHGHSCSDADVAPVCCGKERAQCKAVDLLVDTSPVLSLSDSILFSFRSLFFCNYRIWPTYFFLLKGSSSSYWQQVLAHRELSAYCLFFPLGVLLGFLPFNIKCAKNKVPWDEYQCDLAIWK